MAETGWIGLVLLSAAFHPLRDLMLKGVGRPVSSYVGVSVVWAVIAALQAYWTSQSLAPPAEAWQFVLVSAVGLSFYYYGTLAALRRGNLSVYYPIVRSSPLAIVVFSLIFLSGHYSALNLLGIGLILLGGLMIQKSPGQLLDDPKAFGLAVLAMLGSAAYSLSDAAAMQITTAAPFLFYVYVLTTVMLVTAQAIEERQPRAVLSRVWSGWRQAPVRIVVAGVVSYLSYLLILYAFSIGAEAANVTAVRQASIPVSVVFAAVLLREPRFIHRIGWASLIAAGILCIALL